VQEEVLCAKNKRFLQMTSNGKLLKAEERRINFGKIALASSHPDLLEIQLKSFQEFFSTRNDSGKPDERGPL